MRNQKIRSRKLFFSIRHLLFSTFILVWLILPQGVCLGAPYTLTITADNGSVRVNPDKPSYDEGEKVELIPKPDTGYCFNSWAGDAQGKGLVLTVTMDSDKTIIANFIPWQPPIGIPEPEFGIFETYRMYDDLAKRNPALTYTQNAEGGYYTHYIDNTHPNATDSGNPYGTASKPRRSIPQNLPAGSVVEVHSELPATGPSGEVLISGEGTTEKPIFIRGVGNPRTERYLSVGYYGNSSYIIVEGMSFFSGGVVGRQEGTAFDTFYIAVRNCDFHGDENGGGFGIASYTSNEVHHIVLYDNVIHDNGIWNPEIAEGDQDNHGIALGGNYVWVLDCELYHNSGDGIQIGGAWGGPHHVYVGRNIAHHNKQSGLWSKTAQDIIFSENTVYGHRPSSSAYGTGMGLQYDPKRVWFLFNHVYDNTGGGITSQSEHLGGREDISCIGNVIHDIQQVPERTSTAWALSAWGDKDVSFIGNTMYNIDAGIGSGARANARVIIANNLFGNLNGPSIGYHIKVDRYTDYRNNVIVSNNLFQDLMNINTGCDSCIEADPLFVDASNNDFHLQSTSPAIDAGTSSGVIQEVFDRFEQLYGIDIRKDIEGRTRPQGLGWDIGAYEYTLLPVAVIQNEPKQGYAPLNVSFDGSQSKSPHGDIVSYEWDFGDGTTSTEIKTKHIFTSAGEYTVTLTVTDELGLKGKSQTHIVLLKKEKEFGELPPGCYNNVINPAKGEKALIVVELQKQSHVRLNIYNTRGDKIKELANEEKETGRHKYYWDGKDDSGDVVGSGLYFAHIQAGDYKKTKKIVVVK